MSVSRRSVGLCGLLLAAVLPVAVVYADTSVAIAYCASINTASTSANTSIYQSDGLCYDFCIDDYAYAVVQDQHCWCSNYTPDSDDQVDTSNCDTSCPGYPSDLCGGDNLYGYMSLTLSPSGTLGATTSAATSTKSSTKSSSTTTTSSSTSTTPTTTSTTQAAAVTTTIYQISTADLAKSTTAQPSTSSSSTSFTTSSSSKSTETTSSSVSLTVQTVTQGGIVQTVTVTPTPAATDSASTKSSKKISTGAAVGIAIGVVVGIVIVAAIAFFLWRRKRQERLKDEALFNAANLPSTRGTSPGTMNGLSVAEAVGASSFRRHGPDGSWESDQSGRRRSALMQIDPRIDPGFSDIYARADNKSRDSVGSLRDDHDYSRRVHHPTKVLRATNPDPDND